MSTGDYLCFVDSDDWIDACMVEKMLDFSSDCGKEIICGNYVQEERNRSIEIYQAMEPGIYTGRSLQDRIHGKLLGQEKRPITLSRCMKLFSRTLIVENMKYCDPSIRMGEDMVITLPALLDAQRIVVMEGAAWYHYLFLRESMVHSYDAGMYENIRSLDKIVRQTCRQACAERPKTGGSGAAASDVSGNQERGEKRTGRLERAAAEGMQGNRAAGSGQRMPLTRLLRKIS